jgi:hypothetical protein
MPKIAGKVPLMGYMGMHFAISFQGRGLAAFIIEYAKYVL